jgi:diguanylate cyclase (GGDEF)-like protein
LSAPLASDLMHPFDYRPELLITAWLIALFALSVALDIASRVLGLERNATFGWWLGGSLSVGTGLWAVDVLALLALHAPGAVTNQSAYVLGAWVLAVGAVGTALRIAAQPSISRRRKVVGYAATAVLLGGTHFAVVSAIGLDQAVLARPGTVLLGIAATLVAGVLFVAGLARSQGIRAARGWAWHLIAAGGLSVVFIGHIGLGVAGWAVTIGAPGEGQLSANALALLAGTAASVALTMTRLMAKLERRLTGRTEELAASLRQANEDLQKIAYQDPLTLLPNRYVFEQRLEAAVARAERDGSRLALLFIDLDGFKPINDSFGHSSGDTVLHAVGERLRAIARQGDTMARVGGDEFLMLLEGAPDEGSAALVASRVLATLGQPYSLGEKEVTVSCSIGIVFYPDGGARSKLIAHADAAMYSAKRAGGSTYCFFEPRMEADAREQVELLRDLRRAVEQGELELFYQPKIDAHSGQITAAEALLRWHHPVRGLVLPSVFIPVAERFGVIGALGTWVIEDACRQVREWREAGLAMRVAINLSAHQMRQEDLVERLQGALRRHRIDPSLLTCEITESVAMEDTRATQNAFQRLGRAGIHLSIDDFGTGYSSLSYLRQLPAEELKIDRSFIMDLESSDDARAIVDAVVRLAHALGLKVVAEGVDNPRQCEILMGLGCDGLQGFLFARPMSAEALLEWAIEDRTEASEFRPSLFVDSAQPVWH